MFLIAELLFIVLLAMILFMLYRNERLRSKHMMPRATMEEYWDGKERRRHFRFQKTLGVSYAVEKKAHLKSNGKTVDISESGMKLLLDEKLPKGVILDLMIELPGSKKMAEVEGEVVWSEEVAEKHPSGKRFFHSGIRFSAIKEPSGKSLIDYIRSVAAMEV